MLVARYIPRLSNKTLVAPLANFLLARSIYASKQCLLTGDHLRPYARPEAAGAPRVNHSSICQVCEDRNKLAPLDMLKNPRLASCAGLRCNARESPRASRRMLFATVHARHQCGVAQNLGDDPLIARASRGLRLDIGSGRSHASKARVRREMLLVADLPSCRTKPA
jgi:hypothetical protein